MRRSSILYGAVGAVAATAAAGLTAERVVSGRRRRARRDASPFVDDPPADRSYSVPAEDGVPLHVEEVGDQDAPLTVVYVHGFTLSLRTWIYQRRAIADEFGDEVRQVFYDQRGHGRSGPAVSGSATVEQLGRDLFTVIDTVVPDGPVVLVSHSMGGMTVMSLAATHPQLFAGPTARVAAVALIATSAGGMNSVTFGLPAAIGRLRGPIAPLVLRGARRQAALAERTRRLGGDISWVMTRRLSFADPDTDPAAVDFVDSIISATRIEAIADFYPAIMQHDGREGLAVLRAGDAAVTVVGAEKDVMIPVEHSRAIAAALPDAQYVEVAGSGHVVMLERPDAVDDVLIDLIDGAAKSAARGA